MLVPKFSSFGFMAVKA